MNMELTTQLVLLSVLTVVNFIVFLVNFGMGVGILWGIRKVTMMLERIEDVMDWWRANYAGKNK